MPSRDKPIQKVIKVSKNGPYLVSGKVPLMGWTIESEPDGTAVSWRETERYQSKENYALCRCGQSKNKPFCDGAHLKVGFVGTETAPEVHLKKPKRYEGPAFVLTDYVELCASARFCHRAGGIWELIKADDPESRRIAMEEAFDCPSGRLVLTDRKTGETKEPDLEPSIVAIEDPLGGGMGPLWVRGKIPIFSANGRTYEVRNRVTLCRCGRSENKPFCDSSHYPEEHGHG